MIHSLRSLLPASLVVAGWLAGAVSPAGAIPPKKTDGAAEAGIEVQARGPVHEAFAQLTPTNPDPPPVVSKQPPRALPEAAPEEKRRGARLSLQERRGPRG